MNGLRTLVFIKLMLFSISSLAQKGQAIALQWKIAGELPRINGQSSPGVAGPLVGVHNNVLIVGGGANFPEGMPWDGGKKVYYDEVFVFKNINDSIVSINKTFHLPFSLAYSANCSTSYGIVCAGGENAEGISKKVFLLRWDKMADELVITTIPDLPFALTNASLTSFDNQIFLTGGEMSHGVSNHFLRLDLKKQREGWKQLPSLPKPLSHAVTVVQSNGLHNCLFVMGGRRKRDNAPSELSQCVFQFDLETNRWRVNKQLPYALSAGTGLGMGDHSVLLFGGDRGETFHKTEVLIAAINAEKDELKKQKLIQQKKAIQISHPGFSKEVLLYNTVKNKWMKVDCIPFAVPATTTAVIWNRSIIIPCGEVRAGVRTPQILSAALHDF